MPGRGHRLATAGLLAPALLLAGASAVAARPGSGPRETVDQSYTTTRPNAPTGVSFAARFHAAGDHKGKPPFMRRMVVYPPRGFRYDTAARDRCPASDLELQLRGPDACPAGSGLGKGTIEGMIFAPFAHDVLLDKFQHPLVGLNNANEQIVLVHSEGYTVVRSKIRPDGSVETIPGACFPKPPTGNCVDEYVIATREALSIPRYTRGARSYATTPPTCPARRYWRTTVRIWWSTGDVDSVVSRQPCRHARSVKR